MAKSTSSGTNVDVYNSLSTAQLKQVIEDQIMKNLKKPADFTMSIMDCMETTYSYNKRPQVRVGGAQEPKLYCAIIVKLYQDKSEVRWWLQNQSRIWCISLQVP